MTDTAKPEAKTAKHELSPEDLEAVRAIAADVAGALIADAKDPNVVSDNDPVAKAEDEEEMREGEGDMPKGKLPMLDDPMKEEGFTIRDVEIFRVGEWNGEEYTADDLDDMIRAYGDVGYDVPLKLGHSDDDASPAYGWVTNLRVNGDRLIADFKHMPKEIFEMVKGRRYNAVSSEIFFNLKRNGKSFRRALKAVALLGAATPGVAGLRPLHQAKFKTGEYGRLVTLTFKGEDKMAEEKIVAASVETGDALAVKRLSEKVAKLEAELATTEKQRRAERVEGKVKNVKVPALQDHFRALYSLIAEDGAPKVVKFKVEGSETASDVPTERVLDDLVERVNEKVASLFVEIGAGRADRSLGVDFGADMPAGDAILAKTKAVMEKTGKTYAQAWDAVLKAPENKELVARYRQEVR